MHEFSLTQRLLDTAIRNTNSRRIAHVTLLIGPFSDEREESIRFYWRDLAKGTPGEGAILHFQHVEAEAKCFGCGGSFSLNDESLCAYCENNHSQLLSGEDVRLERIEVE